MKKLLFVALFLLVASFVHAQGTFTIKGRLTGVEEGTPINLCRSEGRLISCFATDTLRNQTFRFQGQTSGDDSECLMLDVRGKGFPNTWLDVWVAPGAEVSVTGNNKLLRTWQVSSKVKEQVLQNKYIEATRELQDRQQQLAIRRNELFERIDLKTTTNEERKIARAEVNEIDSERDRLGLQEVPVAVQLMQESPIDKTWMEMLKDLSLQAKYMKSFPFRKEVVALYDRLPESERKTEKGQTITTNLFPPVTVKVGEEMADADLYDLDGEIHHLADYKGKYMLLDFWSRGCGPCRMALPEMRAIAEMYKDRLTVVSLSSDDEKNWREVSKEENLTWENLSDKQGTNGLYARYGVRGIPHYVCISPEGKVLDSWSGYGKNSLKLRVKVLLDIPKQAMSVTRKGKVKLVNYPTSQSTNAGYLIVKQVELGDTATILRMKVYYIPNNWVKFSSNTYLSAGDGKRYKIKGSDGVTLDQRLVIPESGEAELTLYFEPLPQNTPSFDYMEGESRGDWQIKGISLSLQQ